MRCMHALCMSVQCSSLLTRLRAALVLCLAVWCPLDLVCDAMRICAHAWHARTASALVPVVCGPFRRFDR